MPHPFDEFSKSLAEAAVPRRESLRRLGAVVVGALLTPLGVGTASARDRFRSQLGSQKAVQDPCQAFCKCRNATQQSQCLKACKACGNNPSRLCGSCGTYTCANLTSDPNCGACGNNCGAKGQKCCGGKCADLKADTRNCGACGRACGGATPYCIDGTCRACPAGQTKCGSACVNLKSDAANCGACGVQCAGTEACVNGFCQATGNGDCGYGAALCGGICINVLSDNGNCGGCGVECASDEICTFGVCLGTGNGNQ